ARKATSMPPCKECRIKKGKKWQIPLTEKFCGEAMRTLSHATNGTNTPPIHQELGAPSVKTHHNNAKIAMRMIRLIVILSVLVQMQFLYCSFFSARRVSIMASMPYLFLE